jgi:hypothetical protein
MRSPCAVRFRIRVHAAGGVGEGRALSGAASAGGSRADAILLPGAPPAALRLVPRPAGVVVEAGAAGVRVAGHPVPPGARRLLRPGELAQIQGVALSLEEGADADESTRAAAAALLRDAAAGEAPVQGPRLVVLTGRTAGARHELGTARTIGRGRAAAIRIPDPQASRVHAQVRLEAGGALVEDVRSKNGVRVNGARVERRPVKIEPGDEIAIGETILALEDAGGRRAAASASGRSPAPLRAPSPPLAAALLLGLCAVALAFAGS